MRLWRNKNLRTKLVALTLGVSLVSLVLSTVGFLAYEWQKQRDEELARVSVLSGVVAASASAAMVFDDAKAANEVLAAFRMDPVIRRSTLLNLNGEPFATYSESKEDSEPFITELQPSEYRFIGSKLIVSKAVLLGNDHVGTLLVEASLAHLNTLLFQSLIVGAVVFSICGAFAFLLASLIANKISEPVTELSGTMMKVSNGKDYSTRVHHESQDEIGELFRGFNNMLAEIEDRDRQLQDYQTDLEHRVTQRTQELTDEVLERKKAEMALRREQDQLHGIIRNSPVAIAMFDMELRYLTHSNDWLLDYGITDPSIIGKQAYEVLPATPHRWREIFSRGLAGISQKCPEDVLEEAGGRKMYLRWALQPWFNADGSQGGIIVVSERIDELVKAREVALATAKMKSQFLANMSHELRTPLNGIIGFSDLLKDSLPTESENSRYLDAITSSGAMLLSIINDILDYSKLESGKVSLERIPISVAGIIAQVVAMTQSHASKAGVVVVAKELDKLPQLLLGDSLRLRQVLMNLVGNAIKFTKDGVVTISAKVVEEEVGNSILQFSVEDTGIGVPREKLTLIFEAFSQADGSTTRKFGGTGLGLSISAQLVALMDGKIWVDSEEGHGSTFHFTAKFGNGLRGTVKLDSHGHPTTEATPHSEEKRTGFKILVAEDNLVNQKLIKAILAKAGHEVTLAVNGAEAVKMVSSDTFDIILMDLQMPVMGGIEAVQNIRSDSTQSCSKIPIVALTAHAFEEHKQQCMEAGMNGYLTKPIKREELLGIIDSLVHN